MTMPIWGSAAQVVASARQRMGLNQIEFGKLIGRGQSLVSKYERSQVQPPGPVIMQCMNILSEGQATRTEASSAEVARLVETHLKGPQFSILRTALVGLIESISVAPESQKPSEA